MTTRVVAAVTDDERRGAVASAVELLCKGEVVALPTETVYGLAAEALNVDAALKIFEAKERPRFDPLIVHLPHRDWLPRLTSVAGQEEILVRALADEFWPGPLTMVLPRTGVVPDVVTAGLETVAVRMSAHPVFAHVLRELGSPLAAPSANRFGRISPTEASHVIAELNGRIPLIVDGGPTTHGLESTIVAVADQRLRILRQGPITSERLRDFAEVEVVSAVDKLQAPGQLRSHYAPRTPLVLVSDIAAFQSGGKHVGFLTFERLSARHDLHEAAANLFRCLRELDEAGFDLIVAEELPEPGLGAAIMDRLRRAAAR